MDYLKIGKGIDDFAVEKLAFRGDYPSFKVSAPLIAREKLQTPEFWPVGVIVRRFSFRHWGFLLKRPEGTPTSS